MKANSASMSKHAAYILSVAICTTFEGPTSIIISLICLAVKSLSFILLEQSNAFKNIVRLCESHEINKRSSLMITHPFTNNAHTFLTPCIFYWLK